MHSVLRSLDMVSLLDLGSATITGVKDYPPLSFSGVNPVILNLIPIAHCQCTKDLLIPAEIVRCPFLIFVLTPPLGGVFPILIGQHHWFKQRHNFNRLLIVNKLQKQMVLCVLCYLLPAVPCRPSQSRPKH